ncbi:MAG: hypothetical protein ACFWT5_06270 [Pseudomonas helleri]|jgi:hypothetical protein
MVWVIGRYRPLAARHEGQLSANGCQSTSRKKLQVLYLLLRLIALLHVVHGSIDDSVYPPQPLQANVSIKIVAEI